MIQNIYLLLLFLTPIIFCPITSELFEFPKILLLYSSTTIIVALHLINVLSRKVPLIRSTPLNFPLVLFFISQLVSTYFSIDIHTSLFGYYSRFNGGLFSTTCYILLYFIIVNYLDDTFRQRLIKVSLLSGLIVAFYGIAQHFGIDKNYWVQDVQARVFSTLGQPNWLATYLCLLLPLGIYKLLSSVSLIHKSYFIFLTSSFYLCLLFTKSKTGLIATAISLGLLFFIYLLKNFKSKQNIYILSLVFGLFTFLSLTINNPIKDRLFPPSIENKNYKLEIGYNITPSENIRQLVWQGAISLWQQFPLFGTGVETYAYSYYWTRPVAHNLTSEWDFLYNKAHNEYLNFLATTGTFGFLSYFFIIIFVLIILLKKYSLQNLALATAFISILITNSTGFSVIVTSIYFFLLPSLCFSPPPPLQNHKINRLATIPIIFTASIIILGIWSYFMADLNYNIATSYLDQGYYDQALVKINTSITQFRNEPTYLIKKSAILTKTALLAKEQKNDNQAKIQSQLAIDAASQALAISPANVNLYKEQAQNYYYLSTIDSNYYLQAIDSIIKATKLAPTDAKSYYILGKFWSTISQFEPAITAYQKAVELKANYDYATFALGEIYFTQKNYSQAKKYFQDTLKIAPTSTDAKSYLEKLSKIKY